LTRPAGYRETLRRLSHSNHPAVADVGVIDMTIIRIELGPRSYDIRIVGDERGGLGPFARDRVAGAGAFVVADEHVRPHAAAAAESLEAAGFHTTTFVLPAGEKTKTLASAARLYDALAEFRADRNTAVVAVGGGVVGDLAGFVAATYNRGLPLLMVPTTLLAMVDSSVGGKVGVNHAKGKNLIGAFHQPVGVWIDTATLNTLPDREYRSGLAEVVKYGVILDAEFFAWLEQNTKAILDREFAAVRHVVARCCRLKAEVIERDEREETGLRAALNYGHTFAHAFEAVAGYGAWLHGEAVAAGMVCASRLAERRGLIDADVTERQIRLLEALHLPTAPNGGRLAPRDAGADGVGAPHLPGGWSIDALLSAMQTDKKAAAGRLRFVLPRRLGEVALFDDVPEDDVRRVLDSFPS
jgi:3-dehydroquinate synthase